MGQISILPQGTALPRIDRRVPLTVHRTPPNERSRETDSLGTVSCDRSLGGVRCTVSGTRRSVRGSEVPWGSVDICPNLNTFRHHEHWVDASPPPHHRGRQSMLVTKDSEDDVDLDQEVAYHVCVASRARRADVWRVYASL